MAAFQLYAVVVEVYDGSHLLSEETITTRAVDMEKAVEQAVGVVRRTMPPSNLDIEWSSVEVIPNSRITFTPISGAY